MITRQPRDNSSAEKNRPRLPDEISTKTKETENVVLKVTNRGTGA